MSNETGKLRVLGVGSSLSFVSKGPVSFFTKDHFSDYEIAVVDPLACIKGPGHDYSAQVNSTNVLNFPASNLGRTFLEQFHEATDKINRFIAAGGFCVMVMRKLPRVMFTGLTNPYELTNLLPYANRECVDAVGTNIDWLNREPLSAFATATKGLWQYHAYLSKNVKADEIIGTVKGHSSQVVSALLTYKEGGRLLLMPAPNSSSAAQASISAAIQDMYGRLSRSETKQQLPAWTTEFLLPSEKGLVDAIQETNANIKELYRERKVHETELDTLQNFKALFAGFDSNLEKAVDAALTELGLSVAPGTKKRVDRTATFGDQVFAIEVQGVKKSAAEDHARSLVIWVQEVAIEKGVEPKGLLVVNAFRDEDPLNRVGNPWPDKIIEICERQGFCAISGIQLSGMMFDAKANPERKAELVQRLIDTVGRFEGYDQANDWLVKAHKPEP